MYAYLQETLDAQRGFRKPFKPVTDYQGKRTSCVYLWYGVQRNWVFATNSNFLFPISFQSNGVNSLRKSEFEAKTPCHTISVYASVKCKLNSNEFSCIPFKSRIFLYKCGFQNYEYKYSFFAASKK